MEELIEVAWKILIVDSELPITGAKLLVNLVLLYYALNLLKQMVVIEVPEDTSKAKKGEEQEQTTEEVDEYIEIPDKTPENALFIPLTFPPRLIKRQGREALYEPNDPDMIAIWQFINHKDAVYKVKGKMLQSTHIELGSQKLQTI